LGDGDAGGRRGDGGDACKDAHEKKGRRVISAPPLRSCLWSEGAPKAGLDLCSLGQILELQTSLRGRVASRPGVSARAAERRSCSAQWVALAGAREPFDPPFGPSRI
jgi:hypothetical protein